MGVTLGEKATILDKIQTIAYSRNAESYQSQYDTLCEAMPDIVRNYYDRNWHPIRQEWVDGLKQIMNLCTRTNNRIESFFKHLKSYITTRGSIEELIEGYMSVLSILRNERSYRLLKHLSTVPTKPVSDTEADYLGHVTPYALLQIQEQLKYSLQVTVVNENTVETSTGLHTINDNGCTCSFYTHMRLPCRHMFAVQTFKGESLFMPEVVADRWTIDYYKSQRFVNERRPRLSIAVQQTPRKQKVMSENQKWKECGEVFQVAQNILSQCGMGQYQSRLSCVKQLISLWQENKEAFVGEFSELNEEVSTSEDNSRTVQHENPEEEDSSRTVQHTEEEPEEEDQDQKHHVLFELPDLTRTPDDLPNLMGSQTDQQQNQTESTSTSELLGVRFAPVTKKRGRPKGSCTTAIGLPQKRRKIKDSSMPYHKKSMLTKEFYVLGLFVDTTRYTKGELLGESSVECIPESLPSALLDEHLDINIIRKFFDQDGWLAVSRAYEARKEHPWCCNTCKDVLLDSCPSIGCDSCLNWSHWKCVGLTKKPRKKFWFCRDCQ